eukprot:1250958-Prymnesium_polylepis.1
MMHTPLCLLTHRSGDMCAGLSRWGTVPSCVSISINKISAKPFRHRPPTARGALPHAGGAPARGTAVQHLR